MVVQDAVARWIRVLVRRLPGAMRRSFELGCFSNLLASGETCAMGRWELKLMLGFREMTKCHLDAAATRHEVGGKESVARAGMYAMRGPGPNHPDGF